MLLQSRPRQIDRMLEDFDQGNEEAQVEARRNARRGHQLPPQVSADGSGAGEKLLPVAGPEAVRAAPPKPSPEEVARQTCCICLTQHGV